MAALHHHRYLAPRLQLALNRYVGPISLLDIGCGNGNLTAVLVRPGWKVTGIDISLSEIQMAQRSHAGIEFIQADAEKNLAPLFGPNRFDVVLCAEVIEHVFSPRSVVASIRSVLRPGGDLIVTTPYHGYCKNVLLAASGKLDRHFTALWEGGHIKFWSRQTLTSLIEQGGFRVCGFDGAGRLPWLWKSMILVAQKNQVTDSHSSTEAY